MSNEEYGARRCEDLAGRFDRNAETSDTRAAEFRRRAVGPFREDDERAEASQLTHAEKWMEAVRYWEERAAWARDIAGKFRRRAEEHRARVRFGP